MRKIQLKLGDEFSFLNPSSDDLSVVYVCFKTPPPSDPLWNRVVAYWDPPACHCEIAFDELGTPESPSEFVLASSIYKETGVFLWRRAFAQKCYIQEPLLVPSDKCADMIRYCRDKSKLNIRYSDTLMLNTVNCLGSGSAPKAYSEADMKERYTICSRHVLQCLHVGGLLTDVNPNHVTPSGLLKAIKQALLDQKVKSCLSVLPSRLSILAKGGGDMNIFV